MNSQHCADSAFDRWFSDFDYNDRDECECDDPEFAYRYEKALQTLDEVDLALWEADYELTEYNRYR